MDVRTLLVVAPVLLLSMVAHEIAHGYAALRQGDPTAERLGRLSWNPVKHIDPMMTIVVPLLLWAANGPIFGGAKPVPVDPRNFRNYRRGDVIVSLAGVATNAALAVVMAFLIVPLGVAGQQVPALATSFAILQRMALAGVTINLFLALFNLLPIPPLDGSHVLKHLLPGRLALWYVQIGRFGFLLLMALLWFGRGALLWWMSPAYWVTERLGRFVTPFLLPGMVG